MVVSDNHLGTGRNDREDVTFWDWSALEFGIALDENGEFSDALFELEIDCRDGCCCEGEREWDEGGAVVAGENAKDDGDGEEPDAGVEDVEGLLPGREEAAEEQLSGTVREDTGAGIFAESCEKLSGRRVVWQDSQGSFEFENRFAETTVFLEGARKVEAEGDIVGMKCGESLEFIGCFAELLLCK
jgi:hypothetical protein